MESKEASIKGKPQRFRCWEEDESSAVRARPGMWLNHGNQKQGQKRAENRMQRIQLSR